MDIDVSVMADKLVKLRGNRTQEEVSNSIGISKSALSMYEKGKRIPRDPVKVRIAAFYKKSVPYIFFNQKSHEL